ncbi:MAG: hypothetical protein JWO57_4585, partial [Pseudonocardiales bacterium]|nr:hypothetical protein [Pseudonocardiales bacterium]
MTIDADGQPDGAHRAAPGGWTRVMNQKVAVSVVFVAALFMTIMDTTIINVAIPR